MWPVYASRIVCRLSGPAFAGPFLRRASERIEGSSEVTHSSRRQSPRLLADEDSRLDSMRCDVCGALTRRARAFIELRPPPSPLHEVREADFCDVDPRHAQASWRGDSYTLAAV